MDERGIQVCRAWELIVFLSSVADAARLSRNMLCRLRMVSSKANITGNASVAIHARYFALLSRVSILILSLFTIEIIPRQEFLRVRRETFLHVSLS